MAVIGGDMATGAMKGLFQLGATGMQMAGAKRQQERNMDFTMKLNRINNAHEMAMMEKSHDWAVNDAKLADSYRVQSLQNAGMNPMLAYGGVNQMPIVGGHAVSTPIADYESPMSALGDLPSKLLNNEILRATKENIESQTRKNNSESEGNEINNTFLGSVVDLKTELTQQEYQNAIYLQGYYSSNPDLLEAIAQKQSVLNDNLESQTASNWKQQELFDSIISKNESDISLNEKRIASMYISDMVNKAQLQEIMDRNLRANYSNVGYLINRMRSVSSSNLPDDVKSSKLALLRDLYDNASGRSQMRLQYHYDKNLQDAKIAGQSEQVDKYLNLQYKHLDWQKTQFAWNKVFEVVDKVGDAIIPFYEQKQGQDFQREMQQNQFQHDFDKQSYEHQHDANRQFEEHRFKTSENQKDRDQKDLHFSIDQSRKSDEHHNYFESYEGWYDDEGHFHSLKHNSKK